MLTCKHPAALGFLLGLWVAAKLTLILTLWKLLIDVHPALRVWLNAFLVCLLHLLVQAPLLAVQHPLTEFFGGSLCLLILLTKDSNIIELTELSSDP
jgi:hypothetical protein